MKYVLPLLCTATAVLMLVFPESSTEAASISLASVKNVVIRSLFPLSVLVRLIAFSHPFLSLSERLGKTVLWKRLRLSPALIPAVVGGILTGLPTAAVEISRLRRDGLITDKESRKALALASLPSPVFVLRVAYPDSFGLIRLVLLLVTAYTVSLFFDSKATKGSPALSSVSFSAAMRVTVSSMILVSGSIIFFTSLVCLLAVSLPSLRGVSSAFFEMGTGVTLNSGTLRAAALGWCGLSALSQIKSEAVGTDMSPYIITRVVSAVVMVIFEKISYFF